MIEINLLPKEYRKRARTFHLEKKSIYVAAGVASIVLLFALVTFYQHYQLSSLDEKIALANSQRMRLQEDIRLIDGLTDLKEKILTRMESIERLDRHRAVWVDVLQDLNQRVPDFLWLTRVAEIREDTKAKAARAKQVPGQQAADTIPQVAEFVFAKPVPTEMEGYAFTLSSIASFLVGLTKSDYFENINLSFAKQEDVTGINAYRFKVGCDLVFQRALDKSAPIEDVWVPTIAEK
ncbi:MAG: PilN domain-containing protein [candidate division Zixibacteria bacterium]|nr:PilN domain-containing protein [candidate division Zixibacteria bacterium]MBU1470760.1 PilN domain-containing protein [candidate division Zixibacteria bacterium]MBU2625282.1 PilN domain-containing protein [candidate division Zixibacteria bacterium]